MLNAEEKLADFYDQLMHIAKNSSKSEEDSILLAGAMMAVSRVLMSNILVQMMLKNYLIRVVLILYNL